MKKRIQDWTKRNQVAAAIILNLVMIVTTALFTVIALGPDSLLDNDCSAASRNCIDSHGTAAFWAIFSGICMVLLLARTVWAVRTGRFKKQDKAEN